MSGRTAVLQIDVRGSAERTPPSRPARDPAGRGGLLWSDELVVALHRLRLGRGPSALRVIGALDQALGVAPAPSPVDAPDASSPELCLMELARAIGTPYGYEREHRGALIQQVMAQPGAADTLSSSGSEAELPFHTENSFAETRPDFVILLCRRRGPRSVPTVVLDVDEMIDRLSASTILTLAMPLFEIRSPPSFGAPVLVSSGASVLELSAAGVGLRLDMEDLLTAADPLGKAALAELFEVIDGAGTPVTLEVGEVLVIDNRRAAHARPSFTSTFDEQQRWLQRSLVRIDFWGCRTSMEREGVCLSDGRVW